MKDKSPVTDEPPRFAQPASLSGVFEVSTLTSIGQLRSIHQEWLDLLGRARLDLPFIWPEWTITWWELFRQQRPLIRDHLRLKTVRQRSGELVAIVPMMMTERPAIGPIRVRSIGFLGADRYLTEQQVPIVHPAWESGVAEALVADLARDRTWNWVAWEGLQRKAALTRRLAQLLELRCTSSQPENILHLTPTWEQFRPGLGRHVRDSLRHCYNSLKTKGLVAHLDVAAKQEEIRPALETFFHLHSAIAQHHNDAGRPDRFAEPTTRSFLIEVCSRFAHHDMARLFTLSIGGIPVASRIGFLLPECLYLYYGGYDPNWRKFSVGTTVTAEAIKYAIGCGLARVHLSMGADSFKSRWSPEMRDFCGAVCVRGNLYSRAAYRLYSYARSNTEMMKGIKGLLGSRFA